MKSHITSEEAAALKSFAAANGHNWKQVLREAWMQASEPGILQMLRNSPRFGPAGLNAFRVSK